VDPSIFRGRLETVAGDEIPDSFRGVRLYRPLRAIGRVA
jgi:hypothetical protein